ncbi:hypothetical protein [Sulfurirhabdus autotrophica]|uniref:Peptidase M50B-like protein n=1 Tax=Sulfurirhabdus autotrophica TaxID=1706046 RepID=A0A4V6P3Z3_9PROT|nr:hypothetical protein [Sulfurirhabdus autotrophica]TCV88979.1 hypothetical protein EDC63_10350 [Sulfurirhabdus autotrophica]
METSLVVYLAVVGGFVLLLRFLQRYLGVFFLMVLPGTIAHELSHFLLGALTFGRPRNFSIIPKRQGEGYVLGSVSLANVRWYNGLFIGFAPLLLLPAAILLIKWRVASHPVVYFAHELLWVYCAANLIHGCIPSTQDIRIAAVSVWWVLPVMAVAGYFYLIQSGMSARF